MAMRRFVSTVLSEALLAKGRWVPTESARAGVAGVLSQGPIASSSGSGSGAGSGLLGLRFKSHPQRQRSAQEFEGEGNEDGEELTRQRRLREMAAAGFGGLPEEERWQGDGTGDEWGLSPESSRAVAPRPVEASILRDTFSRQHTYLRISLTERCNLRCTYCMPAEGVSLTPGAHLMSTPELARVARLFVAAGIRKVRLTGGEPTLRKDVVEVVRMLGELRSQGLEQIGMTSNGIVLHRHLPQLVDAGLTHLNLSLDTLKPDKFEEMTRRPRAGLDRVLAVIDQALALTRDPMSPLRPSSSAAAAAEETAAGVAEEEGGLSNASGAGRERERYLRKLKLNVVVMKGVNEEEVLDFVALTRERALNVRFIEWMPFDGNIWSVEKMEPYQETRRRIEARFGPLEEAGDQLSGGDPNAVAKDFRVPGFKGEVSFITSMTEHFCGSCNRLRLMADGNFKVCLFGREETNLLAAMRAGASDGEVAGHIHRAVQRKRAKHAGMFELSKMPNRAMVKIGG